MVTNQKELNDERRILGQTWCVKNNNTLCPIQTTVQCTCREKRAALCTDSLKPRPLCIKNNTGNHDQFSLIIRKKNTSFSHIFVSKIYFYDELRSKRKQINGNSSKNLFKCAVTVIFCMTSRQLVDSWMRLLWLTFTCLHWILIQFWYCHTL